MRTVPLVNSSLQALVDDEDFERVSRYRWYAERNSGLLYARAVIGGKLVRMHRFLTDARPGQLVDHRGGDGLNNTRSNLRVCTAAQNAANRGKKSTSPERYKGVCWMPRERLWMARIFVGGRRVYLGQYKSEENAALVYNLAAEIFFGEYARPNEVTFSSPHLHGLAGNTLQRAEKVDRRSETV